MQFDRHGRRIWRDAQTLLDSEHTRRGVGEVAIPFGVCAEPSNVARAAPPAPTGSAAPAATTSAPTSPTCPTCAPTSTTCSEAANDSSPATDLDDWARAEAMPSEQEVTRIRRLIANVEADRDQLTDSQRADVDQAVALLRCHRTVTLGMPSVRRTLPDLRPHLP